MAALAGLVVLAALQSTTALLTSTRVARKDRRTHALRWTTRRSCAQRSSRLNSAAAGRGARRRRARVAVRRGHRRGEEQVETLSDASAHAEMLCLREAAARRGTGACAGRPCTARSSRAPCASPRCAFRIERLVYGAPDLRLGAVELGRAARHRHPFHTLDGAAACSRTTPPRDARVLRGAAMQYCLWSRVASGFGKRRGGDWRGVTRGPGGEKSREINLESAGIHPQATAPRTGPQVPVPAWMTTTQDPTSCHSRRPRSRGVLRRSLAPSRFDGPLAVTIHPPAHPLVHRPCVSGSKTTSRVRRLRRERCRSSRCSRTRRT